MGDSGGAWQVEATRRRDCGSQGHVGLYPRSFTLAVALTGLLSLCFPIPCGKLLPPESRGKRERDGWIASFPSSETGRPSDEHPVLSERH